MLYKVRFDKTEQKEKCNHKILVVSKECDLDGHSSSPVHSGVCPQCYKMCDWEIRHRDYVVIGCTNEDLKFPYFVKFESLFEYGVEYTEKEVVEKLVEVYKPLYVMNGKRCLYSETDGIKEDILWK